LKVSTNVKIAMQCFENFVGENAPKAIIMLMTTFRNMFSGIYKRTSRC